MIKNKVLLDTNAIINFITDDEKEKSKIVSNFLAAADCIVSTEVVAEVAYNLEKKYNHSRNLISEEIKDFIDIKQNLVLEENVVRYACNIYCETKLDFVDCLLAGYAKVNGNVVFTFDNALKKLLEHKSYN